MSTDQNRMRDIDWQMQLLDHQLTPGSTASLNLFYENRNMYYHNISDILIQTSWNMSDQYIYDVNIEIDPMTGVKLPSLELDIPQGLGGKQSIWIGAHVAGHNKYSDELIDRSDYWVECPLPLNINYRSYNAFVSRSNHPRDEKISDAVQNQIRDWGFETYTLFDNVEDPLDHIINGAKNADCLFGIAMPRHETVKGENIHFLYLDSETGMALARDIPVVIFKHESVSPYGAPNECWTIEFNDPNSDDFKSALSEAMLFVRRTIKEDKQQEFLNKVVNIGGAMGVGALIASKWGTGDGSDNAEVE